MVELRHLRYFIALADELNFSHAAEGLHMAQPSLSAAIRSSSAIPGSISSSATTREVRLTDAGYAFLEGARRTLADADRAAEDAKRAAAGEIGRLRIAYFWGMRFETLPPLGRAFKAGHPDVQLLAQEMWNARMPSAFANGSIDLAVSLCLEIAPELELAPIRKERVVALPEAHPLAREQAIQLSSLARAGLRAVPARDRSAPAPRVRGDLPPGRLRAAVSQRVIPHRMGPRSPSGDPGRRDRSANGAWRETRSRSRSASAPPAG